MVYRKNPENTNAGRPGSVYGQGEAENNQYASKAPIYTGTGKAITSPSPTDAGMGKYDGILKMHDDKPAVFDDDMVGRRIPANESSTSSSGSSESSSSNSSSASSASSSSSSSNSSSVSSASSSNSSSNSSSASSASSSNSSRSSV